MFLIINDLGASLYITGVEEVAKNYITTEAKKGVTGLSYKEVGVLGAINKDCSGLNEFIDAMPACELEEAMSPTISIEQKQFILTHLGFSGRGKGLWWHRALGEDTPANRFHFNLGSESLSNIPTSLFTSGYNKFRNQLNEMFAS